MLCWESHQTNSFIGFWFHQGISHQEKRWTRRQMEEEFHPPAPSLGLWRTQSSSSYPVYPLRNTNVQKYKYNTVTITITNTSVYRPMYVLRCGAVTESITKFSNPVFHLSSSSEENFKWTGGRVQSRFGCLTFLHGDVFVVMAAIIESLRDTVQCAAKKNIQALCGSSRLALWGWAPCTPLLFVFEVENCGLAN